jgi:hypothetical protein
MSFWRCRMKEVLINPILEELQEVTVDVSAARLVAYGEAEEGEMALLAAERELALQESARQGLYADGGWAYPEHEGRSRQA